MKHPLVLIFLLLNMFLGWIAYRFSDDGLDGGFIISFLAIGAALFLDIVGIMYWLARG